MTSVDDEPLGEILAEVLDLCAQLADSDDPVVVAATFVEVMESVRDDAT